MIRTVTWRMPSGFSTGACDGCFCCNQRATYNPLNCIAYCDVIPTIIERYHQIDLSYDPIPEHCSCSPSTFIRGDVNGDGKVLAEPTDIIYYANWAFLGHAPPPCLAAADANGDRFVGGTTDDMIYCRGPRTLDPSASTSTFGGNRRSSNTLRCL